MEMDELLITLVRGSPCLWDKRDRHYRDTSSKREAWKFIGSAISLSAEDAVKRFRALRQKKRREESMARVGLVMVTPGGRVRPRWHLQDSLSFLDEGIHIKGPCKKKKRNTNYCSVPQCSQYLQTGISMHLFPKDSNFKAKWEAAFKMGKPASTSMRVCSRHFLATDYFPRKGLKHRLFPHAVPTQNLPHRLHDTVETIPNRELRLARQDRSEKRKERGHGTLGMEDEDYDHFSQDSMPQVLTSLGNTPTQSSTPQAGTESEGESAGTSTANAGPSCSVKEEVEEASTSKSPDTQYPPTNWMRLSPDLPEQSMDPTLRHTGRPHTSNSEAGDKIGLYTAYLGAVMRECSPQQVNHLIRGINELIDKVQNNNDS